MWLRWVGGERSFSVIGDPDGKKLACAEYVVVETQWGDLHIQPVITVPYHAALSSVFPPSPEDIKAASSVAASKASSLKGSIGNGKPAAPSLAPDVTLSTISYIDYRYTRFAVHEPSGKFRMIRDWRDPTWLSAKAVLKGLSVESRAQRQLVCGRNLIEIQGKGFGQLFVDEVRAFVSDVR